MKRREILVGAASAAGGAAFPEGGGLPAFVSRRQRWCG